MCSNTNSSSCVQSYIYSKWTVLVLRKLWNATHCYNGMWAWLMDRWSLLMHNNWNQECEEMLVLWLSGDVILLIVGSLITLGILATVVYVLR